MFQVCILFIFFEHSLTMGMVEILETVYKCLLVEDTLTDLTTFQDY